MQAAPPRENGRQSTVCHLHRAIIAALDALRLKDAARLCFTFDRYADFRTARAKACGAT